MANVKIVYRNILENSTVNPTNENTSYPSYRLYDRDVGKLFKGESTADNFYITIDQGASASNTWYPVDRLVIHAGHNLTTAQGIVVQYSSDNFGADINSATSWTSTEAGTISKSLSSLTQRYWRINFPDSTSPPELTEVFLGADYTFQRNFAFGSKTGYRANIAREETQSGKRRAVQLGDLREVRTYDLAVIETTQKEDFEAWIEHTEGLKPVYLIDENSNTLFVELLNDMEFSYKARNNIYSVVLEFQEVI